MANSGENNDDFYAVLGLNKECTPTELKNAYKKLAMRWHPDRCSASGNSKFVEESKKKFQTIQRAYSVLSDENKRFLYDVGVYESDDDENGMGDFLSEMAVMMSQTKPNETSREESFEELQQLFDEMFQVNIEPFGCNSQSSGASCSSSSSSNNKRNSSEMNNTGRTTTLKETSSFQSHFHSFCVGTGGSTAAEYERGDKSSKRNSRKSKR
ncbi:hypothetical protein UlMin_012069 [Ulmus minor]